MIFKEIKLLFFASFLLIGVLRLQGQSIIDSIQNALENTLSDSVRIELLLKLSYEYQYTDLSKSFEYVEKAIQLAENNNFPWAKARSYHDISRNYSISGSFHDANKFNSLSLNEYIKLKDTIGIWSGYNNLGTNYYSIGKFDEAYLYYTRGYRLATAKNYKLGKAISVHNIGEVFKELTQYKRALDYINLSQKMSDEINDKEAEPYNFYEIADIYLINKKYDSALYYFKSSLKSQSKIRLAVNDLKPLVLNKLAKTYFQINDIANAMAYYDSAYSIHKQMSNKNGMAEVELGRSMVFMKEKKFDEAQRLMESSALIARNSNSLVLEIQCYNSLSELLELKGEYKKSLETYKKYKQLEDSLFSLGMQAKLLQDQLQFETASKEDQIRSLTRLEEQRQGEIKKQELVRNILVIIVALTIFLLFTVYRSGQRRIQINRLLLLHQEEIKKRSEELVQLNQVKDKFFSIISHDLRSPMNALSGILDLMDNNQLKPEEFTKLNKELRIQFNHTKTLINNLLDWALLQMDKLNIQAESINLYTLVDTNFKLLNSLHLKDIRFINNIPIGTYGWADMNMMNLVLRNLILNSIKFTENGGKIEINSRTDRDFHIVSVHDTGVGISPDVQKILFEKTSGYSTRGTANEKGTGLGLILCKEFVERNGGKIWLESELGMGSTFYFTIKKASQV